MVGFEKSAGPLIPRRTIDGKWASRWHAGQTWVRRSPDGTLEYKQDEETDEEFDARQY